MKTRLLLALLTAGSTLLGPAAAWTQAPAGVVAPPAAEFQFVRLLYNGVPACGGGGWGRGWGRGGRRRCQREQRGADENDARLIHRYLPSSAPRLNWPALRLDRLPPLFLG